MVLSCLVWTNLPDLLFRFCVAMPADVHFVNEIGATNLSSILQSRVYHMPRLLRNHQEAVNMCDSIRFTTAIQREVQPICKERWWIFYHRQKPHYDTEILLCQRTTVLLNLV